MNRQFRRDQKIKIFGGGSFLRREVGPVSQKGQKSQYIFFLAKSSETSIESISPGIFEDPYGAYKSLRRQTQHYLETIPPS